MKERMQYNAVAVTEVWGAGEEVQLWAGETHEVTGVCIDREEQTITYALRSCRTGRYTSESFAIVE